MNTPDIPNEPDLGYIFYPPAQLTDPGHPRLDIILLPDPTGRHFDPDRVALPVWSLNGTVGYLEISHPGINTDHQRVLAGKIIIEDRAGKCIEAFSFGGELQVLSDDEKTVCIYTSPAPILTWRNQSSIEYLLIQEVEIILAERRAAWLNDTDHYEARLARVSPIDLFYACLATLRKKFTHYPIAGAELLQKFVHYLKAESLDLQETYHLPVDFPSIDELL